MMLNFVILSVSVQWHTTHACVLKMTASSKIFTALLFY